MGAAMPCEIAIVGPGVIARQAHVPALAASDDFRLAACVSDGAGLDGVPCFPSIAALRRDGPAVRAVAICTPPQVRGRLATEAIAAGLHVLLEKPPAPNVSACQALAEAARRHGVSLFAAWHSRFAPGVAPARDWLAGRRVTGGRVTWREDVRRFHPGQAWLWQPGGLGVFDPGINALSILTAISPAPLAVVDADFDVPDGAATPIAARLSLAAGEARIAVDLDFRHAGTPCWRIALDTEVGTLVLDEGGAALTLPGDAVPRAASGEYPALYRAFATLIAERRSDCDAAPLQLAADAFLVARSNRVEAFVP